MAVEDNFVTQYGIYVLAKIVPIFISSTDDNFHSSLPLKMSKNERDSMHKKAIHPNVCRLHKATAVYQLRKPQRHVVVPPPPIPTF
jgi:hypothetical protein